MDQSFDSFFYSIMTSGSGVNTEKENENPTLTLPPTTSVIFPIAPQTQLPNPPVTPPVLHPRGEFSATFIYFNASVYTSYSPHFKSVSWVSLSGLSIPTTSEWHSDAANDFTTLARNPQSTPVYDSTSIDIFYEYDPILHYKALRHKLPYVEESTSQLNHG